LRPRHDRERACGSGRVDRRKDTSNRRSVATHGDCGVACAIRIVDLDHLDAA
jgi:hypothetical protein